MGEQTDGWASGRIFVRESGWQADLEVVELFKHFALSADEYHELCQAIASPAISEAGACSCSLDQVGDGE